MPLTRAEIKFCIVAPFWTVAGMAFGGPTAVACVVATKFAIAASNYGAETD